MSGWIALTRDSFKHPLFKREPVTEWEAFARLIRRAAWEDTRHRVGGELLPVARGSFFCTLRDLQLEFMWKSDARVRSFLKRLENERMIERKTNAGKTHVTICKYNEYQAGERKESQALNAPITQDERTKETSKQINNKQDRLEGGPVGPKSPPLFSFFPITVSVEVAKAFVEMRAKMRKPLTPHAVKLIGGTIAKCEALGFSADDCLNLAIEKGWQSIKPEWIQRELSTPTNGASHERPRTAQERAAADHSHVASAWIAEGRRRDEERSAREGGAGDPGEYGMDCGPNGDAVVTLFPAWTGPERLGGGGFGLDEYSQPLSAGGHRNGVQ